MAMLLMAPAECRRRTATTGNMDEPRSKADDAMMAYFGALTGVLLFVVVRGCVPSTSADADQRPVQSSRRLALVAVKGAEESGVHHPPPKT
jgi:hypothetical protein